ncbi:MAG: hypothetical protein AMS22_03570 [Thiotrichales bacterium SG8_50]|nr:MAG: hypothetical protein AMS22_03570 [Thiotrichales bacterium SG8_50]
MSTEFEPCIGDWYETEAGRTFEVVAVDQEEGSVEIQYFDGDVEELDFDTWFDMELQPAAEPNDWTGPFDDLERDDLGEIERAASPDSWSNPLDEV